MQHVLFFPPCMKTGIIRCTAIVYATRKHMPNVNNHTAFPVWLHHIAADGRINPRVSAKRPLRSMDITKSTYMCVRRAKLRSADGMRTGGDTDPNPPLTPPSRTHDAEIWTMPH